MEVINASPVVVPNNAPLPPASRPVIPAATKGAAIPPVSAVAER